MDKDIENAKLSMNAKELEELRLAQESDKYFKAFFAEREKAKEAEEKVAARERGADSTVDPIARDTVDPISRENVDKGDSNTSSDGPSDDEISFGSKVLGIAGVIAKSVAISLVATTILTTLGASAVAAGIVVSLGFAAKSVYNKKDELELRKSEGETEGPDNQEISDSWGAAAAKALWTETGNLGKAGTIAKVASIALGIVTGQSLGAVLNEGVIQPIADFGDKLFTPAEEFVTSASSAARAEVFEEVTSSSAVNIDVQGVPSSFYDSLGAAESSNAYGIENSLGFSGKYQMGIESLITAGYLEDAAKDGFNSSTSVNNWDSISDHWTGKGGIDSHEDFLSNGAEQEKIIREHTASNWREINNRNLDEFVGREMPGHNGEPFEITQSGLLGAAHLGGVGNLEKFLEGKTIGADANGTRMSDYMEAFRDPDEVAPNRVLANIRGTTPPLDVNVASADVDPQTGINSEVGANTDVNTTEIEPAPRTLNTLLSDLGAQVVDLDRNSLAYNLSQSIEVTVDRGDLAELLELETPTNASRALEEMITSHPDYDASKGVQDFFENHSDKVMDEMTISGVSSSRGILNEMEQNAIIIAMDKFYPDVEIDKGDLTGRDYGMNLPKIHAALNVAMEEKVTALQEFMNVVSSGEPVEVTGRFDPATKDLLRELALKAGVEDPFTKTHSELLSDESLGKIAALAQEPIIEVAPEIDTGESLQEKATTPVEVLPVIDAVVPDQASIDTIVEPVVEVEEKGIIGRYLDNFNLAKDVEKTQDAFGSADENHESLAQKTGSNWKSFLGGLGGVAEKSVENITNIPDNVEHVADRVVARVEQIPENFRTTNAIFDQAIEDRQVAEGERLGRLADSVGDLVSGLSPSRIIENVTLDPKTLGFNIPDFDESVDQVRNSKVGTMIGIDTHNTNVEVSNTAVNHVPQGDGHPSDLGSVPDVVARAEPQLHSGMAVLGDDGQLQSVPYPRETAGQMTPAELQALVRAAEINVAQGMVEQNTLMASNSLGDAVTEGRDMTNTASRILQEEGERTNMAGHEDRLQESKEAILKDRIPFESAMNDAANSMDMEDAMSALKKVSISTDQGHKVADAGRFVDRAAAPRGGGGPTGRGHA